MMAYPNQSAVLDISGVDDAMYVLRSRSLFATPQMQSTTQLDHGSVVQLHDAEHLERRRILAALFRRSALAGYERAILIPALDRTFATLEVDGLARVDLLRLLRTVYTEVVARLVGLDGLDDPEDRAQFERNFAKLERGARSKYVEDPDAVVPEALEARAAILEKHFERAWTARRTLIEARATEPQVDPLPQDLITLMLQHRSHYERWGEDGARNEACLVMVASVGSTANAVCHAVYDLVEWMAEDPSRHGKLADPGFVVRSFSESIRLHQTNVMLRVATSTCVLPSGTSVPEGRLVAVSRQAINRFIEAFDPDSTDRFDPYRVVPTDMHDYGLAFGEGPHACLGKSLVLGDLRERGSEPLEGLATATLQRLFQFDVLLDVDGPPEQFADMALETWSTFPVVLRARAGSSNDTSTRGRSSTAAGAEAG